MNRFTILIITLIQLSFSDLMILYYSLYHMIYKRYCDMTPESQNGGAGVNVHYQATIW
jgi:hypothetical protein